MGPVHTGDYSPALKRDEALTHATWTNLKDILLNERSQTQDHISYNSTCMKNAEEGHLWRQEGHERLPRAGAEWLLVGTGSLYEVTAAQLGVPNATELFTLKRLILC